MNHAALVDTVGRLYIAAGRRADDPAIFEVWAEALADVTDAEGDEAVRLIVAEVDVAARFPSPAVVREVVIRRRRARRDAQPALPDTTGPYLTPAENAERLRQLRAAMPQLIRRAP